MYRFFSILSLVAYLTPLLHNTITFASEIQAIYDEKNRLTQIHIPDIGKIQYTYGEDGLSEIQRLDEQDNTLYTHRYHSNELEELPFDLGIIEHCCSERKYVQNTPYGIEHCIWDDQGKLIEHKYNEQTYKPIYDEGDSLLSDFPLMKGEYDGDGKLIQKGDFSYKYNQKDQLIEVVSNTMKTQFAYDDKDRRVYKKIETDRATEEYKYLYLEQIPIAILKNGTLHYLQIPLPPNIFTLTKFVAFETNSGIYIPIYCFPNNISKLINKDTKETISFDIDPYGCNLHKQTQLTPFLFAGKEYDTETGLVYFGYRYYDPTLRTWLTADPFRQDEDHLYSYCFQNPLRYTDPNGGFIFVFAIPLGIEITAALLGEALLYGTAASGVAWLGAKGVQYTHDKLREKEIKKRIAQAQAQQQTASGGASSNPPEYPFKKKNPGNMDEQVKRGQAPKTIERVDKARIPHEKDHVTFKDETALNYDGTWKHGIRQLTNKEKAWILKNGWKLPPS